MYAHIDGILSEKTADFLVIDCGGVGYLLQVSGATLSAAPRLGERMKCHAVLSVREDALELYGFATREEKAMFEKLRSVSGIGSRTALQILTTLSVRDLSVALLAGDAAAISRAPGVGKKIAQRLILELRDKVEDAELTGRFAGIAPAGSARGDAASEAIEALMALGYQAGEAAAAVAALAPLPERTDEIVRMALKGMMK